MISHNLRHLRLFMATAELKSLTLTSQKWHVSQPAVTQALNNLEQHAGGVLLDRSRHGVFLTPRGEILLRRVQNAFSLLDSIIEEVSPRLRSSLTFSQLRALTAVGESENFTLAAHQLGLAQPTVHRAVRQVEEAAGRSLFERTAFGIIPTRFCQALVQAARLARYELDQAEAELVAFDGGEAGSVVIGAMPLARVALLPKALALFREEYATASVRIIDGTYDALLQGLRRGTIDILIGALREPSPIHDVVQEQLFGDRLALLAGPQHPLAQKASLTTDDLLSYPWVVPKQGTPTRMQFEMIFKSAGCRPPQRLIDSGSLLLMRGLLRESDHLGCISRHQAKPECDIGLLVQLRYKADDLCRPIGLTFRDNWQPTRMQRRMVELLREVAPKT